MEQLIFNFYCINIFNNIVNYPPFIFDIISSIFLVYIFVKRSKYYLKIFKLVETSLRIIFSIYFLYHFKIIYDHFKHTNFNFKSITFPYKLLSYRSSLHVFLYDENIK